MIFMLIYIYIYDGFVKYSEYVGIHEVIHKTLERFKNEMYNNLKIFTKECKK